MQLAVPAADVDRGDAADLSVLTYNVKGLPWPLAMGRPEALREIGSRLARMRAEGRQPNVVVLQEAFTAEAKAIGASAGYAWRIEGPYARPTAGNPHEGAWHLGETQSAALDSGLAILSDLPVLKVERAPFPAGACAGFDCLAAKGVLMVTVAVPGKGPVTIATTHLNSRKASGAPYDRTHLAYRRQAAFAAEFLRRHRAPGAPLIFAGDFNRGARPVRIAALDATLGPLSEAGGLREGLLASGADVTEGAGHDAALIVHRGRDMQFVFDGADVRVDAIAATVPFGTQPDSSSLSDHLGFEVRYRLAPRPASDSA